MATRLKAAVSSAWTLAAAGLALTLLVPHAPLLLGYTAPIWDAIDFFAPYYILVGDFTRSGEFLLWNPFTLGGSPDYLEPQLGSFSPAVVLFGLVFGGTRLSFELYWLAVWLLGGAGFLALARHLGASPWGGFVVALAFVFSGFYTGNAQNTAMLYSFSFLPWLVWRVDVALMARGLRPALEAGALSGLSGLGGYPALVLLNGCFVLLWTVGRLLWFDGRQRITVRNRVARAAVVHVAVAVVAAAVLSPTYIPFLIEGPDVSDRAGAMAWDDAVDNNALHPAAVVTLTSPVLARADLFHYTDISMRSLYVGCLVPVFAAVALVARRPLAFRVWLLMLALLFLAAAMGRALPVRGWLYEWFPPTRYFRHPALFRCYTIFALTLLGVYGLNDFAAALQSRDSQWWRRFAIATLFVTAVALALYGATAAFIRQSTPPPHALSHWHTLASWSFVCLVAAAGCLSVERGWRQLAPAAFVLIAVADALSTSRLVRPTMYDVQSARWLAFDDHHRSDIDLTPIGLRRDTGDGGNLAFVSKMPTARGYSGLTGRLARLSVGDEGLVASVTGRHRLWYSRSAEVVDRSERCFERFRARAAAIGAPPLVIHPGPSGDGATSSSPLPKNADCELALASVPAATQVNSFTVWAYRPARLTLRVDLPDSGWLLVTDTWSRGWRATVNGRENALYRGNFVFRAVRVSAGTNFVDFRYEALGFPWLLLLSWGLLIGVAAASAIAAIQSRVKAHASV